MLFCWTSFPPEGKFLYIHEPSTWQLNSISSYAASTLTFDAYDNIICNGEDVAKVINAGSVRLNVCGMMLNGTATTIASGWVAGTHDIPSGYDKIIINGYYSNGTIKFTAR